MRSLLVLTFVMAALACAFADELFDKTNESEVLGNAESISKCLIGEGPCTPLANSLHALVVKSLPVECSVCTADEKRKMGKVFNLISSKYPEEFKKYTAKLDPKGEKSDYITRFLAENQ